LRVWLVSALLGALATTGCVRRIEEAHVFAPRPLPGLDVWPTALTHHHIEVAIGPDEALRGWHIQHPDARATLLFFYGSGEKVTRAHWRLFPWAERFRLNILCLDYRGFGFSDGQPGLAHLRSDALRVFDATRTLRAGKPTLVMGYSMGTVAAIHVASHRPVDGLALMAPISRPEEVLPAIQQRVPWYLKPFLRLEPDPALLVHRAPLEEVRDIRVPLIVLHGEADPVIPVGCGRRVFEAAPSPIKTLCLVPGAAHNDLYLWQEPAEPAFRGWLERTLARREPAPGGPME